MKTSKGGSDTVEVVFRYGQWSLNWATVTRDLVEDYYETVELMKKAYDIDDCLAVSSRLRWIGTSSVAEVQVLKHAGRLILPEDWTSLDKPHRQAMLLKLMLEFAG